MLEALLMHGALNQAQMHHHRFPIAKAMRMMFSLLRHSYENPAQKFNTDQM